MLKSYLDEIGVKSTIKHVGECRNKKKTYEQFVLILSRNEKVLRFNWGATKNETPTINNFFSEIQLKKIEGLGTKNLLKIENDEINFFFNPDEVSRLVELSNEL